MSTNQVASALDWWREAGVDAIVGETPRDWLAPATRAAAPAPPPAPAAEALPDDLDAFQAWFVDGARLPLGAPAASRVGPAGAAGARVMVLIDMPTNEEAAAGKLFAGEVGALFDRMMAATKVDRDSLYVAPLSPIPSATGQLDAAVAARLAEIARHHVGLVAPDYLLMFGDICAKALLGTAVAGARGKWHEIDTPAGKIRTLVTIKPHKLMTQPGLKKLAWEDLQLLKEELSS